jgi:hypothetical protein
MTKSSQVVCASLGILILASALLVASATKSAAGPGYQLVSVETAVNPTSGDKKRTYHWQYDDGTKTTCSAPVLVWGNHTNRGTKTASHH